MVKTKGISFHVTLISYGFLGKRCRYIKAGRCDASLYEVHADRKINVI